MRAEDEVGAERTGRSVGRWLAGESGLKRVYIRSTSNSLGLASQKQTRPSRSLPLFSFSVRHVIQSRPNRRELSHLWEMQTVASMADWPPVPSQQRQYPLFVGNFGISATFLLLHPPTAASGFGQCDDECLPLLVSRHLDQPEQRQRLARPSWIHLNTLAGVATPGLAIDFMELAPVCLSSLDPPASVARVFYCALLHKEAL